MGTEHEHDPFSEASQRNARLMGEYHRIAENVGKCVFCDLRDKYIVVKNEGWVLTVNIFPYIDGQLLVLPTKHIESYEELTAKDKVTSDVLIGKGINILKHEMGIENYWIILRQGPLAGKTVKHLHWNVMPYIDGLNTWHNQEIEISPIDLAERLRKAFENGRD